MKHVLLAAALVLMAAAPGLSMESLSHYAWKNRVLVLFGAVGDQKLRQQIEALETQNAELADREMIVLHVRPDTVDTVFGKSLKLDAGRILAETGAKPDRFSAVLVGKDGGVKLRSEEIVSTVALFDLIDRMPMRQSERR